MKNKILIIISLMSLNFGFCQDTVKMSIDDTMKQEMYDILDFLNISIETLNFESKKIKNKYYEIKIDEYKKGKLKKSETLFTGDNSNYFKIDSTFVTIKLFCKIENNKLTTSIRGKRFSTEKIKFKLKKNTYSYVLKNFLGSKPYVDVPLNEKFPVLTIITPTINEDGSGSYCEVAQSKIAPEKYGEKYNIPHYFVITMEFK